MFDNEQLKVLKECLDNKYGENLIRLRELGDTKVPQIQEMIDKSKIENEIIKQIHGILIANYSS